MAGCAHVYFLETYVNPDGTYGLRVHRDGYHRDTLSPTLIALVRVVARNASDATARVLSGRLEASGVYVIGGPERPAHPLTGARAGSEV